MTQSEYWYTTQNVSYETTRAVHTQSPQPDCAKPTQSGNISNSNRRGKDKVARLMDRCGSPSSSYSIPTTRSQKQAISKTQSNRTRDKWMGVAAHVPFPRWREDRFLGRKPRDPCLGCSNLWCDILADLLLPYLQQSEHT